MSHSIRQGVYSQGRIFIKSEQKIDEVKGRVLLWYMIIKEPRLIAATTEDKLDIDGVEEGAPAL